MLSMLIFAAATAPVPSPSVSAAPVCQNAGVTTVRERKPVRAQKLNALPNADQYLTVLRTEDGCSKPAIVNYDIGSAPKKQR